MDRLLPIATVAHACTAIWGMLFESMHMGYPTLLEYIVMFITIIAALAHTLSYVTIPLTVIALVYRWAVLRRSPAGEAVRFRTAGTIVLVLLQIILAIMGWSIWQYIMF